MLQQVKRGEDVEEDLDIEQHSFVHLKFLFPLQRMRVLSNLSPAFVRRISHLRPPITFFKLFFRPMIFRPTSPGCTRPLTHLARRLTFTPRTVTPSS